MTASFRAAASANNGTGSTSLTISRPTGTLDTDGLLMVVTARGGTGTTITPPGKIAAQTSSFGSTQINDVASNGSNMFVAVGNSAKLATSSDGNTWTQNASHPFTGNITCVAYGNGLWVALDDAAHVATATDPTSTWTNRTGSWDSGLIGSFVDYVNGFYVFGGYPRQFWYSSDGVSWSQPSTRPGSNIGDIPRGIAYANGYYATALNAGATANANIYYATTIGGTWTAGATNLLGSGINGYGPAYRNGMWVVASYGTSSTKGFAYRHANDPTGSWTYTSSTPFTASYLTQRMKGTAEGFIQAAGLNGNSGELAYSSDGITWRLVDTSAVTDALLSAAWDDTQAVVVTVGNAGKLGSGGRQWTLLSRQNSTTTLAQAVFYRTANKEPASYGVTLTSAKASGIVVAIASGTNPEALGVGAQVNSSSTTVTSPAIGTWTAYASGVDLFFGGTAFGSSFTPPASYTEPTNGDVASTPADNTATTTEVAYQNMSFATSVGSIAATAGSAAVNIGHHIFVPDPSTVVGTFTLDATIVTWSRWSSTWSNTVGGGSGSFTLDAIVKRTRTKTLYRPTVLGNGPDAYYRLGEPSGTTMTDSSTWGRDGTYLNSPTLGVTGLITTDDAGTAATFNHTPQSRGRVSAPSWIASSSQTLEGWINVQSAPATNQGYYGFRTTGDGSNCFYVTQLSGGQTFEMRRVDSTGGSFIDLNPVIQAGIHHIALVYDNSTLKLTGFVDGIQVAQKGASGSLTAGPDFAVGNDGSSTGSYCDGTVDEVAYYSGQHLTQAQLLDHWQAGVSVGSPLYVDAIVKKTQTGSFTADAIVKKTISGSFTADAVVKKTQSASFTIDAIVKATISSSFTANAIVKATISGSFTANAVVKATISGSFTANAVIKATITRSFTADAVVLRTVSGSFTANAQLVRTVTASFTVDADIKATISASFTANAVIFKTQTASLTANAVLFRTTTSSFTANAVIFRTTTGSFTLDAVLFKTTTSSFTVNAVIKRTVSASFTADAVIFRRTTATFTADAVVFKTQTGSFTLDAVVKRTETRTFTADAVIRRTVSGSFTANAVVMPRFKIDAFIVGLPNSIRADAIIRRTETRTFDAQAIVKRTATATLTADAFILKVVASGFTADAIKLKTASSSITADAVIRTTRTAGVTIDAVVVSPQANVLTLNAVLKRQEQRQLVVDAVLQKTVQGQLTLDASLRVGHTGSLTVDAVIAAGVKHFTVDAVIRVVGTGSFVAAAFLVAQPTQFEPIVATNSAALIEGQLDAALIAGPVTAAVIEGQVVDLTILAENAAEQIEGE